MIKVIIFDLDNTLYNEEDYVFSGFKAIAHFLHMENELPKNEVFSFLKNSFLKNGRGRNFDDLMEKFSINNISVEKLVSIYRAHIPNINLYPKAKNVLKKLNNYKLSLLTNGSIEMQKLKIEALQLGLYFDSIFLAEEDGVEYKKPHMRSFLKILSHYKVNPDEVLMIGDDIANDIGGASAVGINTFLIKKPHDLLSIDAYIKDK